MDIAVLEKALEITGLGLAGVFIFMAIFLAIIVGVDKLFPYKKDNNNK
ncbi:MAG: hypothetical protein LBR17_02470 [Bacteroidales bacterium]|jgi:Na+-transporting methylmalonyl-CoA/oxaloacetate decarboxylase gamma subunit|nr:hypothetical protein [Bacteroidales bacterium]